MSDLNPDNLLDQYIQRLQNVPSFNVYKVMETGDVAPWYEVTGEIVKDLVIRETNLALQVETVAPQIMHWSRLVAQAKRVWEIEERYYRVWRDRKFLEMITPPADPELAKGWKKPTEAACEAMYRTDPEYPGVNARVERAEEAFNAASGILDAFKAKRDMLRAAVVRAHEQSSPRMSI